MMGNIIKVLIFSKLFKFGSSKCLQKKNLYRF